MDATQLSEQLTELATRYRVPGASVAVLANGTVTEAAHGVLNTATGVETTTDSLFQIGSISKAYTATMIRRASSGSFRAAIGHMGKPGDPPQPAPMWGLMRSCGPGGLITSTAADVITFARMHLDGGGPLLLRRT